MSSSSGASTTTFGDPMNDLDLNFKAEARAITKALKSMLEKARAAGIANPSIYIESEGSIHVMDMDHPGYHDDKSLANRQDASVGAAVIETPYDCGGW